MREPRDEKENLTNVEIIEARKNIVDVQNNINENFYSRFSIEPRLFY